jgi:hypothetical protein
MSPTRPWIVIAIVAAGLAVGASRFAVAAPEGQVGGLAANEGIFVDPKSFSISKGVAKTDPAVQIMKLGAREVTNGAIIFRHGDKLYLVDADPKAASLLNSFSNAFAPPG